MNGLIWLDASPVRPLVGGHRGASAVAPENTAAAFEAAIDAGADFIETDVRLTRDGIAVALHDGDLLRLCGDDRRVADLDLAELRQLHPRVATISEVITIIGERCSLLLDIKLREPAEQLRLVEQLAGSRASRRIALGVRSVEAFDLFHEQLPDWPKLGLFEKIADYEALAARGGCWARLWEADAFPDVIAGLKDLGLRVLIMVGEPARGTVGLVEPEALCVLLASRPDAVMLNDPALAVRTRENSSQRTDK